MVDSLVLIVPIADVEACRIALDEAGYGPNNLSIPMRGKVQVESAEQATHWGSHWWAGEQLDAVTAIVRELSADAVIVSSNEIQGFELFDSQAGEYIYVPADPRLIEGLTMGLGELSTPGLGLPYAQVIPHPRALGWPLLQLRSEDIVPISLSANPEPLSQVLAAFVAGGGLTQAELDGIIGAVQAMAGQTVRIVDMIPASWQPYIMTKEQAQAARYFEAAE